jgi:hypothetical protein
MRNKYYLTLLLVAGVVFFWSCKSTGTVTEVPPETPPTPEAPPAAGAPQPPAGPDQAALDALDAAIARAEKERRLASDFQAPSYLPAEWSSAEADYRSIQADRTSTAGAQDAEQRYRAIADRYHEIFQHAVSLYAADIADELQKARDQLIAAGIEDLAPDYLDIADQAVLDAEDSYLAEDYYAAGDKALEALDRYRTLGVALEAYQVREEVIAAGIEDLASEYLIIADVAALDLDDAFHAEAYRSLETEAGEVRDRYQTLKVGLDAYALRKEVLQRDFADFDRNNFTRADETLLGAVDAYEAGAVSSALNGAGESKAIYNGVLGTGWAAYAAQLRTLAQRERRNALDAKANVAVRDDFSRVDQTYNQAESAYNSRVYANAADLYIRAESGFVEVILAAEVKRRIAQVALETAEKKLVESENTALDAERILEGGAE